jgi:predicted PhzF superfamily epimerase YddE/YHI9
MFPAVCLDGRGLTTEQMQDIARETNSVRNNTCLLGDQAAEPQNAVRARIFTVQEELPFAGHLTLGTAFVLRGSSAVPEIRLQLNVELALRFEDSSSRLFGEMTQLILNSKCSMIVKQWLRLWLTSATSIRSSDRDGVDWSSIHGHANSSA